MNAYVTVAEYCRRQRTAGQTLYRLPRKYGKLDQDEAHRLNSLNLDYAKLKNLLAEALMANDVIREVVEDGQKP
jgi:hypothetical protein